MMSEQWLRIEVARLEQKVRSLRGDVSAKIGDLPGDEWQSALARAACKEMATEVERLRAENRALRHRIADECEWR